MAINQTGFPWRRVLSCLTLASAVMLSGCSDDGDNGAAGPQGPQGEQGPAGTAAAADIPEQLSVVIDSATVAADGTVSVELTAEDEIGRGFSGLTFYKSENSRLMRFGLVKLQPEGATGDGNASEWQSYIESGNGQATTETNGTLTDNGDGSYTYVFSTNATSAATSYEPSLTHRVAMQLSGSGFPTVNASYDWVPAGGSVTDTRNIVTEATCNSCHGKLALHGEGRIETSYCVTCHNPGSVDPDTGNTVDFKVMVHKIHRGANLPSVKGGTPYQIIGYGNNTHDYSEVEFPRDIRDCGTCHTNTASTPDYANWNTVPTQEACGSCHDDIDFPNASHGNGIAAAQADNSNCTTCHNSTGITSAHDISGKAVAGDKFQISFSSVVLADSATPGLKDMTVTVKLEDDTSTAIDLSAAGVTDKIFKNVNSSGAAPTPNNPNITYSWIRDGEGYQNSRKNFTITAAEATATAGEYSYTVTDLDLQDGDTLVLAHDTAVCANRTSGNLIECDSVDSDGDLYAEVVAAKGNVQYFSISGNTATDITSSAPVAYGANETLCADCHGQFQPHIGMESVQNVLDDLVAAGSGGTHYHGATELGMCRLCHNGNRVSFEGQESTDLKSIVHRFHKGLFHNEAVEFPDEPSNCAQCHDAGQYDLPIQANEWAQGSGSIWTTPTTAVCSSCHLEEALATVSAAVNAGDISGLSKSDQALIDHMQNNGASFAEPSQADAYKVESCSVCHAIGKEFGVDAVHEIR